MRAPAICSSTRGGASKLPRRVEPDSASRWATTVPASILPFANSYSTRSLLPRAIAERASDCGPAAESSCGTKGPSACAVRQLRSVQAPASTSSFRAEGPKLLYAGRNGQIRTSCAAANWTRSGLSLTLMPRASARVFSAISTCAFCSSHGAWWTSPTYTRCVSTE
jgi:hypothetical protein